MSATTTRPTPVTGQVPRPTSSRVRVPQLAVGLLLTAGAALAFLLWNASSVARVPVVAVSLRPAATKGRIGAWTALGAAVLAGGGVAWMNWLIDLGQQL